MQTGKVAVLLLLLCAFADAQRSSSGGRSSSSSRSSVSSRSSSGYSYYSYSSSYYSYSSSYSYYRGPASPGGQIAGAVIGGVFGFFFIVVAFIIICKRRGRGCNPCSVFACLGACCAAAICCCCARKAYRSKSTTYGGDYTSRADAPVITNPIASDPDGPSFGGGNWGHDPSDNPARLKYVQGNPSEVCQGFSAVFPSGRWSGYYVEWSKRHNMQMELRFFDGQISGGGSDPVGQFLFFGIYRDSTKRAAWVKQYVGQHCVEYRGVGSPAGVDGDWALLDNPNGTFVSSDAFHLQCDQRIPPDQIPGPPPVAAMPPPPPPPPTYNDSVYHPPMYVAAAPGFEGPPAGPPPGWEGPPPNPPPY